METANSNLIVYSIPGFLFLVFAESLWDHHKKTAKVRFNDGVSNLANGLGSQITGGLLHFWSMIFYYLVFNNIKLINTWDNSWMSWVLAIIVNDLCYYWYHRSAHRVNILWGTHSVHHQSEEFNLTVALRQAWFDKLHSWFFYLPMAFLGIPPHMFLTVMSLNLIYQFWVHTQFVNKLGFLEYIFVTPSGHRVHHGKNEKYLDKNYGGIFIVWDILFGSFQKEEEEVLYGVVVPPNSWNPFYLNIYHWKKLWELSKKQTGIWQKIKLWMMPPDYLPPTEPKTAFPTLEQLKIKFDTKVSKQAKIWSVFFFAISLACFLGSYALYMQGSFLISLTIAAMSLISLYFSTMKVS